MLAAVITSAQQTAASTRLSSSRPAKRDLESLVRAVRANDPDAWVELISRFEGTLRSIARSYRLGHADVDDVLQTVWLRLYQRADGVRDPNAIGAWLVTTTRRASLNALQKHTREHLTEDSNLLDSTEPDQLDVELLEGERNEILQRALATLPVQQRRLMVMLATAPTDYRGISARLNIPMGSIGPTRARSLDRLRRHPELRNLHLASR
jgi:RNA polymerase sigma factor (sigma-70 family)